MNRTERNGVVGQARVPGPPPSSFSRDLPALIAYWRLAVRRTWERNSALALFAIVIVISFLRAIADPTLWESPLRATTALFAALACTIVLGSALRRHSLFGSKRFRLAPVDGDALLLARVVLGNPVRLLAVAAVLLWGLRVVIARDSHVLSSSLDVGALLALC